MSDPTRSPEHDRVDACAEELAIPAAESPFPLDFASISPTELQESFRRLELLYDLGRTICAETDDTRVFETILSAVATLLSVERAFVAVLSGGKLMPRATYQIDLSGEPGKWPVSSTMLRRVLDASTSVLTTDALHDALYGNVPSVDLHNIRSVVCCPLGTSHAPIGLVYADNRVYSGAFSRSDLEFLTALSHYAFMAIKNAEERRLVAAEKELAEARYEMLSKEIAASESIIGESSQIVRLYGVAKRIAGKNVPVLIFGETGTGKELFARLIHTCSPRAKGPFVPVHVGALPKTMVESELFGHERGAFTGAEKKRIGRFELANGGTLFLDEIQDIELDIQPKLLRVLEQRTFERLGSNEPIEVDVRTICASNVTPEKLVEDGLLREDLYYRLNSVVLEIPPLRERPEDIGPLIQHFSNECGSDKVFNDEALACLMSYDWPGNVRELRNCIAAVDALVDGRVVRRIDLPKRMQQKSKLPSAASRAFEPLVAVLAQVEKEHILKAIELAQGKNEKAIRILGISRAKFFQRKKQYGL